MELLWQSKTIIVIIKITIKLPWKIVLNSVENTDNNVCIKRKPRLRRKFNEYFYKKHPQ